MPEPSDSPVERPEWIAEELVARAVRGAKVGNDRGESLEWRGWDWFIADERVDGNHVHLTLTSPRPAQYQPTTNDG